MDFSREIAVKLLQIKAIIINPQNPFTWASGLRSPIYCDNRVTLSYPEIRSFIKQAFVEKIRQFAPFNAVVGVATAGIPHGALLADRLGLPFAYVRSKAKEHGRQNQLEGRIDENARVVLIEDLISTGGSSIKAAQALQDLGYEVAGILSIFDYKLDISKTNFKKAKIEYDSLSHFPKLLEVSLENQYIKEEDYKFLRSWNSNPEKWSDEFIKIQ